MDTDNLKVIGGVIAGVALGTIVGLLTAPDSGDKTRKKLNRETSKFKKGLNQAAQETLDSLKQSYQAAVDEVITTVKENDLKSLTKKV